MHFNKHCLITYKLNLNVNASLCQVTSIDMKAFYGFG